MRFFSSRDTFPSLADTEGLESFFKDDRLTALCDLIPDGLIVVNRRGEIVHMNIAAESMNEVSRRALIGQHLSNLVDQSQLPYHSLMDDFTEGGRTSRVISGTDDRSYTLITRSIESVDGKNGYFLIYLRNGGGHTIPAPRPVPRLSRDEMLGRRTAGDELERPFITCPVTEILIKQGQRTVAMGSRLLLLGESGVGKSQLAKYLHDTAGPANRPFVHINCGSIPEALFESEMFGYERGSFTGASSRGKKGLIECADGGTLFLDEVGEIPLQSQAKILQVLEEGMMQRVGATSPRRLRMQVIAATNCDLRAAVSAGTFRRDLYYRLNVITLLVPPLRERRHLLPRLIDYFLDEVNLRRTEALTIDQACRERLLSYPFPGNIRELQNIIEYLSVVCEHTATVSDLPMHQMDFDEPPVGFNPCAFPAHGFGDELPATFAEGFDLRLAVRDFEKEIIQSAINQAGSKRGAAKLLNVDIATIVRKSKEADVE